MALSRVTLVGERRRVDLVLPSQEPVGVLLPEVMRLLDDQAGERPELRHLVTADGSALALDSTLETSGVADGAVLRLVRVEDAPSAPVVHDVTDEAAGDLDVRAWRWGPRARSVVCGGALVGWALLAGVLARSEFAASRVGAGLLAVAALAAVVGALLGRARHVALAAGLISAAGALGVLGAWTAADANGWGGAGRLAGVALALAVASALLGLVTPLGRGGLVGAAALAGATAVWEVALATQGDDLARVGAVLAVVCVVALGVLPRLALTASGLAGLDDRRSGGVSVSRYQVRTALAATHRGLALATLVLAASAAVAGVLVVRDVSAWTVLLAVATALVLALRARAFPLIAEVVALLIGASAVVVRLVWVWLEREGAAGPLALLVVLALTPLLVLAVRPAEHVRVRLRRFGDVLESVGVIALVPLLLGVFGVYGRLLDTFA
ncbi:type VII secretion integral membrane protein EccD [Streptomyces sp. CC224B]|uniref:type VII secretion integral membrane protein EccD n=1 Tax=Streptomyces sp. CC224B TaxID=3044571 RepID=UPI0024A980D8|nr:type VII secretion integral membrane protein EccD [Streptomyces sp. CC224B]